MVVHGCCCNRRRWTGWWKRWIGFRVWTFRLIERKNVYSKTSRKWRRKAKMRCVVCTWQLMCMHACVYTVYSHTYCRCTLFCLFLRIFDTSTSFLNFSFRLARNDLFLFLSFSFCLCLSVSLSLETTSPSLLFLSCILLTSIRMSCLWRQLLLLQIRHRQSSAAQMQKFMAEQEDRIITLKQQISSLQTEAKTEEGVMVWIQRYQEF